MERTVRVRFTRCGAVRRTPARRRQAAAAADRPEGSGRRAQPLRLAQGEGDYEANRRYRDAAEQFAQSGKVEQAAEDAAPDSAEEAEQMRDAEDEGRARAKK